MRKDGFIKLNNGKKTYIVESENLLELEPIKAEDYPTSAYIGSQSAEDEWTGEKVELARHMFVHTKAYNKFLLDTSLILLGRTGTGKTAILKCMEDDVRLGRDKSAKYKLAISLNAERMQRMIGELSCYPELASESKDLSLQRIKDVLKVIIHIMIMQSVIDRDNDCNAFPKMHEYIGSVCGRLNTDVKIDSLSNSLQNFNSIFELILQYIIHGNKKHVFNVGINSSWKPVLIYFWSLIF